MMLERDVIQQKSFRNLTDEAGNVWGFQVCIRQKVYRGTWLSQFRFDHLAVDGVKYGPEDLTFTISGVEYTYDEMAKYDRVMWPIDEMAFIKVKKPGGLETGAHQVHVNYWEVRSYLSPASTARNKELNEINPAMSAELILV